MPTNSDLVNDLLNQPIPRMNKVGDPKLSSLVEQRRADALIPVQRPDTRLPYKTYDETVDNFIYDPTDFDTVRELIKANVAKAIEDRFPVVGDKYTLTISDLNYEKPKSSSLAEEKDVLKGERSLQDRLRGTWILTDTATGKEVARKNATILNVPRMTSRGTFIRNGSEVGLKHMFRLKPGIYARIKGDGTPSVHINPAQTTGRQMSINMDPETGVMSISRGTRTYGVLPMLLAAGISEDAIESAWGKDLLDINKNKYGKLISNQEQMDEYRKLWDEGFAPIKLDPETTELTMGIPYDQMQPDTLLGAANKVVKLARSMSVDDEDDRDSMAYQRVMGPADYIPERIVRDGGGLLRKMFQRVIREGNLDSIESGAFQPQVDAVFTSDKHASYIDGSSPFESLDNAAAITRIGEGGIGSVEAAPAETRGVNDSYLGFVSPIRSVESLRVGLDGFMTYGVKKDSKGNLYARFTDKNGEVDYRPMGVVARSVVTTPEFYDPNGDPEEFIPAFNKGKGLAYVPRKDVDYYLTSSNNMMSIGEGMIPNLGGIRSNRTLMGCLHPDTNIKVLREGKLQDIHAKELLEDLRADDKVISIDFKTKAVVFRTIRGVHKVDPKPCKRLSTMFGATAIVSADHKWVTMQNREDNPVPTSELLSKAIPKAPVWNPQFNSSVLALANNEEDSGIRNHWVWDYVVSVEDSEYKGYLVDIDVDDHVYMLSNGLFTHNSKYNQQALPLRDRETPLVQRKIVTDNGEETTSEKVVARHLGAKFSPVTGRVVSVTPDEIVVRDNDGTRHTVDLYNMYPANQKGYLHNTPSVEVGQPVSEGQLLADSNYTKDGSAALGTNLKVAFMSGHGAENFEDAIAISESAAKKLASEQMYKFKGDLTKDTTYGKEHYLSLFGQGDYTQEQLDKLDENGMPKIGAQFEKGDPIFLGTQIRDLSTSGLSRNSAVPYVKTWEHEAPGTVVDVVKGRKHLTVYTHAYTPMQVGDKMCYDDQTEVMTKRGWVLFKDLLADDLVLTLDIRTMATRFSEYEAAFKYYCDKEPLYRLTSKRLDIATTSDHRHVVAAMNNARYVDFQTSKDIFGKGRWFLTNSNFDKSYCYAYSRDGDAKERWEKYTGYVYCITVPDTHTMFVRRNGKTMWSGNSGRYGSKGIVSKIIPDEQMVKDSEGKPYDVILSPLSLPSRLNTAMLGELQLSKVAKLLGHPIAVPDFITDDTIDGYAKKMLDKYGLKETTTVYDPRSGKYVDDVSDGYLFHFKLKHMAELKERGRGTGSYSSEDVPLKGEGAARRLGMMETSAVYSGGGMDVLRDAKLLRGQRNDEFWKAYRDGLSPDVPGTPLVHKKFFAHLLASGANIEPRPDGSFKLGAATNKDIYDLTGNRQVTQAATFDSKNMHPIQGGLFDPNIFGDEGDQWGYYDLPEPVLNPLMFKPIANIMGWTDTELREYLQGQRKIDDKFGPEALIEKLKGLDLEQEVRRAKDLLNSKGGTLQQRDLARKRIRTIEPLLQQGIKPEDLFFTRLPILPPRFRTVTVINGGDTNIAADANFLYKKAIDAANDLKEAREKLPGEFQTDARESLYNAVNALVGTMPTDDPKLEAKGVGGLLKWAFGKGSPKMSSVMRKVFGSNLDLGGLGTIIPDNKLKLDQVGIPLESAWKMYEPFVVRDLRQNGYSMVQAMREVLDRTKDAEKSLRKVMSNRPLLLNRAPTLWRYGIQGLYPVPVEGNAIRVNPAICKNYGADFDGNCCDFDSKIFVKISKSALDKLASEYYIDGSAKPDNLEEVKMGVTKDAAVFAKVPSEGMQLVSIGEFPRPGIPVKDKNGADVYELPAGVEVLSIDPQSGEQCFKEACTLTVENDCECVEITVGGRKAVVSTNATVAVFDPEQGGLLKVEASAHNGRLVPILKQMPIAFGHMFDRDIGWWLGSLLSDGWISDRMVGYTKLEDIKRKEFVRIARTICENFTANEYQGHASDGKLGESVKVHLFGKDLVEACKQFDIYADQAESPDGRSSLRKQIPYSLILNGSEEFLYGLLSGLLDGDGSIVKNEVTGKPRFNCRYCTSSPAFRETFEFLLYRLGIRFSTTVTPPRNWSNEAYTIAPSTVDMYPILDKLTCVGERENAILTEWKQHAPKKDDTDTVPISNKELAELRQAGLNKVDTSLYSALGRASRSCARATAMKHIEFIEKVSPSFAARVKNTNTHWRPISSIKEVGKRQVFDFAIPGTKVFVINAGVTIYDSMTTHVPVSQTAIDAINKNMLPSKNLLSPKNFKAHYIPRDAANEGLYLASRIRPGEPVRFKTHAEAEAAYKRGEIKVDTPIIIG